MTVTLTSGARQLDLQVQHGDAWTLNVLPVSGTVPATLEVWVAQLQSPSTRLAELDMASITGGRSYTLSEVNSLALRPSRTYVLVARDSDAAATWFTATFRPSTDGVVEPSTSTVRVTLSEVSLTVDLTVASGAGGGGDVVGPSSSVDGRAVLFDGLTGKLLKQATAAPVLEGDSRLTNARTPTGGAGGALSGTYPDPGLNTEALQDAVGAMAGDGLEYNDATGELVATAPVLFADWGLHHYDTDGAEPTAELNPADDLTAWENGGGREFWNVPTTGTTRLLIHDEIDRTLSGVWVYDADAHTIVRASDADTTAKLHGKHVIAIEYRDRASGEVAVNPAWRPINTTLVARDSSDPIGTAVWDCVETIDTETFNTVTGSLLSTQTARPGYRTAANMVFATAVDGSAANLDVLFPIDTAGELSTPGAGDFTTIVTLPVATVVGLFGEVVALIPYGSDLGLYQLKASGPWTPIATVGGEVVMVLGGTVTGQPAFWQGINDRGDGAVTPAAAPTAWFPFSVTPAQAYFRRTALLTRYTAGTFGNWSGSPPSTVAAALDRIAAAIGPIA